MDETEPVTRAGWKLDPAAFSWRFSRSSGAGGQHVNTTDSKAELICTVGRLGLPEHVSARVIAAHGDEIRVVASNERSQRRNRDDALERLGVMIDVAARVPRTRRPTRPGKGAVERRITAKKHTAARKADRRWRADE
jgi:ribosome-associated protein